MVPNSQPPVKFRLNHTSLGGKQAMEKDYSLWIGDLSPDVDDYTLYKGFASRYPSVRLAKGKWLNYELGIALNGMKCHL